MTLVFCAVIVSAVSFTSTSWRRERGFRTYKAQALDAPLLFVLGRSRSRHISTTQIDSMTRLGGGTGRPRSVIIFRSNAAVSGRGDRGLHAGADESVGVVERLPGVA